MHDGSNGCAAVLLKPYDLAVRAALIVLRHRLGPEMRVTSDADDAKYVHKLLAEDRYDLIIGSGHGGHHNWMLMYPRGSGYLTARGSADRSGASRRMWIASSSNQVVPGRLPKRRPLGWQAIDR